MRASYNYLDDEGVRDLADEVRARVHAAGPSRVPGAELLASCDCESSLVNGLLLFAALRDGVGLNGGAMIITCGASQGGTVGARVTVGCNRGVRAVGVAGSPAARARCAGDDALLADFVSAPSVAREVLEVAEGAPGSGADALYAGDSRSMTLGEG